MKNWMKYSFILNKEKMEKIKYIEFYKQRERCQAYNVLLPNDEWDWYIYIYNDESFHKLWIGNSIKY